MKKFFLLFIAIYFLLYVFPFPLYLFGNLFGAVNWYFTLSDDFTVWFGKSVMKIQELKQGESTGSGDTLLCYVGALLNVIVATAASLLLLIFFRSKINSRKIFIVVSIYARCYLAYYCISYGFAKVQVHQFPDLTYFRLAEPYGDSTPMGLFWTLMSGSKPYTVFSGWLEVIAGYLIFFRRTKTIGGLLAIILMTQIVMINLCYDVCVKLFSIHLLCMSLFILGEDINKMFRFFILHQSQQLSEGVRFKNKKWLYLTIAVQSLALIAMSYKSIDTSENEPFPASIEQFRGVYQRRDFDFDKQDSSIVDKPGWQEMIIDKSYDGTLAAKVIMQDRTRFRYTVNIDTVEKKMEFVGMDSKDLSIKFHYKNSGDTFYLNGSWAERNFKSVFIKRDKSSYNLTKTGFHWIQEQPNNR